MITKWYKEAIKMTLASGGSAYSVNIPVRAVNNVVYYLASGSYFNMGNVTSVQLNANTWGVSVGTDDTPATDTDYNLKSTITTGISGVITNTHGLDSNGRPYITYNIVISNLSTSDIVIKEIGYKANITAGTAANVTSNISGRTCLIDRTVLSTPLTVPAQDNAAIHYTLKTDYNF